LNLNSYRRKCPIGVGTRHLSKMDWFDDVQIEEISAQDFVEEISEDLFAEEEEDAEFFKKYLNSNFDY